MYNNFSIVKPCSRCYTSTERPQPVTRSAIEPIRLRQSVLYLRLPFPRPGKYYFRNCRQPIPHKLSDKYAVSRQHCHLPKSCDTSARRQLLMFPSSTACIATDSNAQLSQHDSVLIALKPTTGGILLALTLTAAASTRPYGLCGKYLRQTSRPPCFILLRISKLITAEPPLFHSASYPAINHC